MLALEANVRAELTVESETARFAGVRDELTLHNGQLCEVGFASIPRSDLFLAFASIRHRTCTCVASSFLAVWVWSYQWGGAARRTADYAP